MFDHCPTVKRVIGCAIDVHRALGPGLLESAYERCVAHRLRRNNIRFATPVALPIRFDGVLLDCGYRMDLVVDNLLLVEMKSIDHLLPIHSAHTLTYLKLSGLRYGLLINFNVTRLTNGLKSFVNPRLCGGSEPRVIPQA